MTVVDHPELRASADPGDAELDLLVLPAIEQAHAAVLDQHED